MTVIPRRIEGKDYVTLAAANGSTRTTCEVCGISVRLERRAEYGANRCKAHRTVPELRVVE